MNSEGAVRLLLQHRANPRSPEAVPTADGSFGGRDRASSKRTHHQGPQCTDSMLPTFQKGLHRLSLVIVCYFLVLKIFWKFFPVQKFTTLQFFLGASLFLSARAMHLGSWYCLEGFMPSLCIWVPMFILEGFSCKQL